MKRLFFPGASLALALAVATVGMPAVAQSPAPRLTQQALANAAYPLDVVTGGPVQLKDGKFEDPQNQVSVTLTNPQASGDLNGDGAPDAAVTLAVTTGASGVRSYIAAVLNDGGTAKPVSSALLGDRIRMRTISIARNGEIAASYLDRRFDQPMSARPTIPVTRRFKLNESNALFASAPLANADLNNTTYPLPAAPGGNARFSLGQYRDPAGGLTARILPTPRANGDLDGDGSPDSAVVMTVSGEGEGTLFYLCAVLNRLYKPQATDCVLFGDRVAVTGLAITDGVVTLRFLDRKPEEPMTARPSLPTTSDYLLADGKLISAAGETNIVTYACAEGKTMKVTYGKNAAVVEFDGAMQVLLQRPVASGVRYANDTWELRGKGDEATLADAKSGQVLAGSCVARAPAGTPPAEPSLTGVLTGTVTYRPRIALPPNAVIEVQLADIAIADAPAKIIASQTITAGGAQVPIPFELKYDPAAIQPRGRYSVAARITEDGKLTWISTKIITVLAPGAPSSGVEIVVEQVPSGQASAEGRTVEYDCAGGKTVKVVYGADSAEVTFDGQTWTLPQVPSASGVRYDDGTWEWRSKGPNGFLVDVQNNVVVANDCRERASDGAPGQPVNRAVMTGTVTYLQRVALPPNAIIEVQLADVSKQDVAATVIASQTIQANGAQVPIPFELVYDPAQIDQRMEYAVSARITVDGKLTWISTTRNRVLTRGAPATGIEIVVKPVP
ncbi:MAG: hypothetical protein KatS3mg053_2817 [Candidatus Roseilinea sp.]|nr:MAG: hypothetical protein KatS3mg053_2817 [Candidatus Roseilinea sp.]